jgi:lysophospholipase L1-like esterase
MKSLLLCIAAIAPQLWAQTNFGSAKQFQAGDVVTFIGDSITHGGTYHAVVEQFYATRYPDRQIRFYNRGIGGDRSSMIMSDEKYRLNVDILAHKPTQATIMLGMNDIHHPDYRVPEDTPEILKKRQTSLDLYDQTMNQLMDAVSKSGATLTLITPSIYDETTQLEQANKVVSKGGNAALGVCAAKVTAWSQQRDSGVVRFYEVMNEINTRGQRKDPAFTLVGPDRVHPGPVGHFVMAFTFLKAQGVRGTVATISVDARKQKPAKPEYSSIEGLKRTGTGIAFDATEDSLPMVVADAVKPALDLIPFMRDMNRETLRITGLKPGNYEVSIDGSVIGEFEADALKLGVDIAENEKTPQYKQSSEVTAKILERVALGQRLRALVALRYGVQRAGGDGMDPQAFERQMKTRPASKATDAALETLHQLAALETEYDGLNDEIIRMAKPVQHHYVIAAK